LVAPLNQTRPVYTVSELTRRIKTILEQEFPLVWIAGEVSNLSRPTSGHHYLTLKDTTAQISAVVFKGQAQRLKFRLENGLSVVGLGRVSVYEPRGTYQVIFEHLEPKGLGALQLAFDQLKKTLASEGLFDDTTKKKLPALPRKVHIITSPTGAVVHDTIQIIQRRFPNMPITVIPALVQGDKAEGEIIRALEVLNRQEDAEVAILARGGGSLEDLQPFNSEPVARAIFASKVPIISAVGHETDVTIADFAADMRAPTPSAAAEIAVPEKHLLEQRCHDVTLRLARRMAAEISYHRNELGRLSGRLRDPRRQIQEMRLKLDDIEHRLHRTWRLYIEKNHIALKQLRTRLNRIPLRSRIEFSKQKLEQINYKLKNILYNLKNNFENRHRELTLRLVTLNPLNVLDRGFSITRTVPAGQVVKSARQVRVNQQVEIQLSAGTLLCRVEGKQENG